MSKEYVKFENALWVMDDIGEYHHVSNAASHKFLSNLGLREVEVSSLKKGDWAFDVEWLHRKREVEQQLYDSTSELHLAQDQIKVLEQALQEKPKEVVKEVRVGRSDLGMKDLFRELWKRLVNYFNG